MRGRQPEAGCPFVCHSPHYCCLPPASRSHHRTSLRRRQPGRWVLPPPLLPASGGQTSPQGLRAGWERRAERVWRFETVLGRRHLVNPCVGRAVKACFQQPALPTQMSLVPLRPRPSGSAFQNAIPPQSARFSAGRSPVRPVTTFRAAPQPPGTSHTHLRDTPH